MGEINIPRNHQVALKAVNNRELDRFIDQSIREEKSCIPHHVLADCGPFVSACLRSFYEAIAEFNRSKSPRKRDEARGRALQAGSELYFAVGTMKQRVEDQEKEGQLFFVDDDIGRPSYFAKHLRVMVSYQWRSTVDEEWKRGCITFVHDVEARPDYTAPVPKRKPSAAKQEPELQYQLSLSWEQLTRLSLYAVREYLKSGRDRNKIPKVFQAKTDPHTRGLNNFSTQFWS
ncbi:hypothetical protein [Pseudoroseomonas sp. WGS1072]|uniref:hypothetical protein n=1 Tax=Roseomonas sp. WGS1072 TaxID=3366816 RepID=UPI003BF18203